MVDFLPSSVDPGDEEDRDPRVVGVDSDDADDLMAALSSDTSRDILAALYDEPSSPAALADRVDTSLQNVQYHLGKLEDGDLVEVVDTVYSSKGREMDVYGPSAEPLVLFAGNEEETVGLKTALTNLLGGVGALGLASLVVQRLATGDLLPFSTSSNAGSDAAPRSGGSAQTTTSTAEAASDAPSTTMANDATTRDAGTATTRDAATPTPEATETATQTAEPSASTTEIATEMTESATATTTRVVSDATTTTGGVPSETVRTTVDAGGTEAVAGLPPGLLFFAGGLLTLTLGVAVWYVRRRR